jgi:hypothetical protein
METEVLLRRIADSILSTLRGPGAWELFDCDRFEKIDDPLLGLQVGDVVYSYCEDIRNIVEDRVLVVVDGVGYIFWNSAFRGPVLSPINSEVYARTKEGAVERSRGAIEDDLLDAEKQADNLSTLKSLLALSPTK